MRFPYGSVRCTYSGYTDQSLCHETACPVPVSYTHLFEKLQEYLKALHIDYSINPKIVRGLDYYTKTVFEFITTDIGAQGTVCGGGRYDGLIEQMGGKPTPAMGFAMGLERLIMTMAVSYTHLDVYKRQTHHTIPHHPEAVGQPVSHTAEAA